MRLQDKREALRSTSSGTADHIDRDVTARSEDSDIGEELRTDSGESDDFVEDHQLISWSPRQPQAETRRYARELRAVLARLAKGQSPQRTPQRIVVAGVTSGLEASAIARGLAATCAGSGFRVLLVDANLEQPTVHRDFEVSNEFGLSDLLSTANSPHRLPQSTALPNLAVIAAGPMPANCSSLLVRERILHRLEPISRHFDYILVDAGTLPASLASRVACGADNVVVAVKEHRSSMRELENMIRTLRIEAAPEPAVLMIE